MRWTDSQFGAIAGLVALVAVALVVIARARGEFKRQRTGREDWEETLAAYKNLRIKGVLDDDEYRKIRALLESGGDSSSDRSGGSAGIGGRLNRGDSNRGDG
jgi:hypothetical protein